MLEVVHAEEQAGPIAGVLVQLGGQTPLGLAKGLEAAGVPIVGTSPSAIDLAEDRGEFGRIIAEAGVPAPKHGTATTYDGARAIAEEIGYPVLVRPSYVLGGRGMEIVYDEPSLKDYIERATEIDEDRPVLVDRFLDDAVEIDVDALFDGTDLFLGGVMEHIEEAGVHSGDSACALPPITLGGDEIGRIRESTRAIAAGVGVRGLINIQFALAGDVLYVLEANPRASRTVPFVSKATATPLAKAAARVMLGEIHRRPARGRRPAGNRRRRAAGQRSGGRQGSGDAVQPVPHLRGLVRRHRARPGDALDRGGHGHRLRLRRRIRQGRGRRDERACRRPGAVFVSVANRDKRHMIWPVKRLADLGFEILATSGTASVLRRNGVPVTVLRKLWEEPDGDAAFDGRRQDPGAGRAADHQHPARGGLGRPRPPRRLRDPDSRDRRRHPEPHHGARAGGRGAGHRGAA